MMVPSTNPKNQVRNLFLKDLSPPPKQTSKTALAVKRQLGFQMRIHPSCLNLRLVPETCRKTEKQTVLTHTLRIV